MQSDNGMSDQDLEALASPKIKETVRAAIEKVGREDFLSLSGLTVEQLSRVLGSDTEYLRVILVTLACQINKTHGDPDPNHSSVSECLKGTVVRLPQKETKNPTDQKVRTPPKVDRLSTRSRVGPMFDLKSVKILNFSGSVLTFLVLGYFFGGIVLAPLLGLQPCVGVTLSPLGLSWCVGSVLGFAIASMAGLAYTYYYFVKKV